MIYLCIQPDIHYFHWQLEVMISSFEEVGVDMSKCHIVLLYEKEKSKWSENIKEKYPYINIHCYKDDRDKKHYPPSIKPYGFSLFLKNNKEFENVNIFYHDSDIILTKMLDERELNSKTGWLLSDTISYIGYYYLKSKGEEQIRQICDFFGIKEEVLEKNLLNSGGAQYVINNTNSFFWEKVYKDSNSLYDYLTQIEANYKENDYPIQKWCAEMWSTLWNAWLCNIPTQVIRELDFCFSTDRIEELEDKKILHNAGVTAEEKNKLFFKGEYINNSPLNEDFDLLDKSMCSYRYVQQIKKIKNKWK